MGMMPRWLRTVIITAVLAVVGWAAKDRLGLEHRITTVEEFVRDVNARLNRIETKLDRALQDQ